ADDTDAADHINIDVTGNQYWWHYDYQNEEIATSQDMYIPVNTKVYVHLITSDVLHSFWVPSLSGKLDVNPEKVNTMYIEENEESRTSKDMYISMNTKIYVHLITSDVLHSFWVPSLSGKLDVNPENVNTMYIEAYEEGVYFGKCAELCGPSHSLMDFKVVVV